MSHIPSDSSIPPGKRITIAYGPWVTRKPMFSWFASASTLPRPSRTSRRSGSRRSDTIARGFLAWLLVSLQITDHPISVLVIFSLTNYYYNRHPGRSSRWSRCDWEARETTAGTYQLQAGWTACKGSIRRQVWYSHPSNQVCDILFVGLNSFTISTLSGFRSKMVEV